MSVELTQSQISVGSPETASITKAVPRFYALAIAQTLSKILVVVTFFLISLGSFVRNEGAGLSCPDWPLCFGRAVPPMSFQIFLEWFHRLIAGSVSIGILTVSTLVFTNLSMRKLVGKWCALALLLLAGQVALGGMTVLGLLHPGWVSSHLAVGLAFFATLVAIRLKLRELSGSGNPSKNPLLTVCFRSLSNERGFSAYATVVLFAIYIQCLLGGGVSTNYAGLACGAEFPKCNGAWWVRWADFEGLVRFHWVHRLGAAAVTVLVLGYFAGLLFKSNELPGRVKSWSMLAAFLLALQIFLGIGNVIWKLPVLMSVAHLAVAALLVGSFVVIVYELRRAN